MAPLTLDPPRTGTEADHRAAHHFAANRAALSRAQSRMTDDVLNLPPDLDWLFARDGYLTALEPGDRWHTDCSVPLLAGRAMLKTLDRAAGVACFLNPTHAAQVRVALDHLETNQALIAIVPDLRTLAVMLRCDDFSGEVSAGRLWFAWGERWADELGRLFDDTPGLPGPSRFVRMPLGDASVVDGLIADAQRVFAAQNAKRIDAIARLRSRWTTPAVSTPRRVCVVARSMFRLWDDAGHGLLTELTRTDGAAGFECRHFDPDSPANSSPLALATTAAESDAIVSADVSRADAPALAPAEMPWLTWVTAGRIPAFHTAGPRDRLLLVDALWSDAAARAGWPADRIGLAGWPVGASPHAATEPFLAMIADTCDLEAPESLGEYSSHLLLWEKVLHAVRCDPFALPGDVDAWLREQARADAVAVETLDVPLFVNRLVVPAYQQALADTLIKAGLPLRLHGAGWAELPAFREHAAGAITSRGGLHRAAETATALVHAWPSGAAHAIDSLGRPVVRRTGRRRETFVREAAGALKRAGIERAVAVSVAPPVSAEMIARLLSW